MHESSERLDQQFLRFLMDLVRWEAFDGSTLVSHQGVLRVNGAAVKCYRFTDGHYSVDVSPLEDLVHALGD